MKYGTLSVLVHKKEHFVAVLYLHLQCIFFVMKDPAADATDAPQP